MIDPVLELQGVITARLKANDDLRALIDRRVYDSVPRDRDGGVTAKFPYVSFGPTTELQDDADCIAATEFTLQIDAWSREPGFPEVRRIAKAVKAALHEQEITLAENALATFEWWRADVIRAPDGITSHAAITFRGVIEQS
ncbi:conserved hypothetical protein [Ancylobacter novellus DSM 506]|uniref:DUF3168 domain-containing protein n=1 Tax=Ancylobacter novellus (strain ATCC 8093 / DSM 506 / JCM 20403 / CCM 1077 / IAM 12100 / NBRC 12443 / NCIMB 10456) TaxID=639283 RepID=D6ZZU4_ANCN5|nr:DUF3168 domain-containing protein [Ancylobacter novellus]ADH87358.1 conserved hypothetical protein [Ancylobacter novellus DSM 506]